MTQVENNNDPKWYAVYTNVKAEKKVFERLSEAGYEVYLPLLTTMRVWSDRKKKVTVPLISSYVFIKIEENLLQNLFQIQGITGVLKYLKKPAVIRNEEIENLKILLSASDEMSAVEYNFQRGDRVKVIKGAFQGLTAECFHNKGKHRIIVTIDVMNSSFEVNIPLSFVAKL